MSAAGPATFKNPDPDNARAASRPATRSASMRTEAGPRFHRRVPFLDGRIIIPRHGAQIIQARQLRRRRNVGQAKFLARQPAPPFHQPGNIIHMHAQIGLPGADRIAGRIGAAGQTLVHLLIQNINGDLALEFLIEPGGQPPGFGAQSPDQSPSGGGPDRPRRDIRRSPDCPE